MAALPVYGEVSVAVRHRRRELAASLCGVDRRPNYRTRPRHGSAGARIGRRGGAGDDHSRLQGAGVSGGILTGVNSASGSRTSTALFDRGQGHVEVGLGSKDNRFGTAGYEELAERKNLMFEAEHVRLMYVAATRARDHLVVSLRRSTSVRGANVAAAAISEYLAGAPELWDSVDLSCPPQPPETDSEDGGQDSAAPAEHSVEARAQWEEQRENLIGKLARPSFVAATALGRQKQEDKEERETPEPWRRGRAGTSVGRAVHAVLQSIDLATGDGIADRARAQAVAEGVPGQEGEIARLSRIAIESDVVKRTVSSGCLWREVSVAVSTGGGSLHGFIDRFRLLLAYVTFTPLEWASRGPLQI